MLYLIPSLYNICELYINPIELKIIKRKIFIE